MRKITAIQIFMSAILVGISLSANSAPSFDCAKAVSLTEKSICGDADLEGLDNEITSVYRHLTNEAGSGAKSAIKRSQVEWLRRRNECKSNARCIAQTYKYQIFNLKNLMAIKDIGMLDKAASLCDTSHSKSIDSFYVDSKHPINFDINNDTKVELVKHREFGCGANDGQHDCFEILKDNTVLNVKLAETFVGGYSFAKFENSYFVLGYESSDHKKLRYVGVITPDNIEHTACSIHENEKQRFRMPFEPDWF